MIEQAYLDKLSLKARFFKGFSDPIRLAILEYLREGERSVSEISKQLGQSISNVSNHLACLLDCGLVKSRRVGKNIYYSLSMEEITHMLKDVDSILETVYSNMLACTRYGLGKGRR